MDGRPAPVIKEKQGSGKSRTVDRYSVQSTVLAKRELGILRKSRTVDRLGLAVDRPTCQGSVLGFCLYFGVD